MAGNSFGTLFRITTFGESHGPALGVVVDGCPAGLLLDHDHLSRELSRRRPGQSHLVSSRSEEDQFEVLSGLFEERTTGAPLTLLVRNQDAKSKDYERVKDAFRPGHADFAYFAKYGVRDHRGGGRASARETVSRVLAGAVAKQLLSSIGVSIVGGVVQIGSVKAIRREWEYAESNLVRSVDPDLTPQMLDQIEQARAQRDSVGGSVEVQALHVPLGWGEPVFSKLDGEIGRAMLSIPAVKGVEIGGGFELVSKRGSEVNDRMFPDGFATNNHGGVLGGITTGAPVVVRIALKPTSSIPQEIETIDRDFQATTITTLGRHDPCVAIRAVPVAEAMLAIVLVDAWLQDEASSALRAGFYPREKAIYGLRRP